MFTQRSLSDLTLDQSKVRSDKVCVNTLFNRIGKPDLGKPKKRRLGKPDNVSTRLNSLCERCRGGSTETCRTCIHVTTTWTHINSSPNIVITGSLVNTMWQRIMWPCTLPTTRDTHWPVVTPGGFCRTLPRLPDLKLIRSNFFCLNSARLDRIGKSDTVPYPTWLSGISLSERSFTWSYSFRKC